MKSQHSLFAACLISLFSIAIAADSRADFGNGQQEASNCISGPRELLDQQKGINQAIQELINGPFKGYIGGEIAKLREEQNKLNNMPICSRGRVVVN